MCVSCPLALSNQARENGKFLAVFDTGVQYSFKIFPSDTSTSIYSRSCTEMLRVHWHVLLKS